MESYIGEIRAFAISYAPDGWLVCDGSLYPVAQYQLLYALIGTMYGGGAGNFRVPNMGGLAVIGAGERLSSSPAEDGVTDSGADLQGPGYPLAQLVGQPTVTLTSVPAHSHGLTGAVVAKPPYAGLTSTPSPSTWLSRATRPDVNPTKSGKISRAYAPPPEVLDKQNVLNAATLSPVDGTALPHNNIQPYLALLYCICWQGTYPSPVEPPTKGEIA